MRVSICSYFEAVNESVPHGKATIYTDGNAIVERTNTEDGERQNRKELAIERNTHV